MILCYFKQFTGHVYEGDEELKLLSLISFDIVRCILNLK